MTGAGPKAVRLDRAMAAGLHVPAGVVLPDELLQAGGGPPPLPCGLRTGMVAVRSAFSAEDRTADAQAGRFLSVLDVPADDLDRLGAAVARVYASGDDGGTPPGRRDILVMRMVAAERAGVAFTQGDFEDDLVDHVPGTADALVAGRARGARAQLPKLRRLERAPAGWRGRLAVLLRGVRDRFGPGDWDVEWADDGVRCWLVQLRPITAPPRRDEAFTLANHREILPRLPSRLMTGLIADNGPRLFAWFRAFDPELPAGRPMVEAVLGRPMINLSLLVDMTRIWGIPTRLVTNSLGGGDPSRLGGRPAAPLRLVRKAPVLLRVARAQRRDAARTDAVARGLVGRARDAPPGIDGALDALSEVHARLVVQMSALTSAMSIPIALLRRLGTLEEHAARERTAATAMIDDLAPLRTIAATDPGLVARLAAGDVPTEGPAAEALQAWLARHGQRGVYESDVARPRHAEDPGGAVATLLGAPARRAPLPPTTRAGRLTRPLWLAARGPLRAREQLRATSMIAFAEVRRRLVDAARAAVADGRMASVEDIWLLDPAEARALDRGWQPPTDVLASRRRERERLESLVLPQVVRRLDDPECFVPGAPKDGHSRALRGVSLTRGEVTGRAWRCAEPGESPPGWDEPTILVAPAVDPGWITVFARVDGVVVETGGDLSHGSILLRELGLPAVTDVDGALTAIGTGRRIRLRAGPGVVDLLD